MHAKTEFLAPVTGKLKEQTMVKFVGYNSREKWREGVMIDAELVSQFFLTHLLYLYYINLDSGVVMGKILLK